MDKVGILVVSKCLSSAAIIDTFARSERYAPEFYVAERQVNPLNFKRAKVHKVIPDLDVAGNREVRRQAQEADRLRADRHRGFRHGRGAGTSWRGRPGSRCSASPRSSRSRRARPTSASSSRGSAPKANPRYKVFDPSKYQDVASAVADLRRLSRELTDGFVIKPDAPARGAGVGVWGKDFKTEEEAVEFFLKRLLEGEGRRRGAHRGRGVELPRVQRRAPLRRRPLDEGLQAGHSTATRGSSRGGWGATEAPRKSSRSCPRPSGSG